MVRSIYAVTPQIGHIMQTQKNVMVLDHDSNTLKLCETMLTNNDTYTMLAGCTSLREALHHSSNTKIDLLITESSVNGQSGLHFANELFQKNKSLKVLVISTTSDFELIKEAFRIGVHGFLTKPLLHTRLKAALATLEEEGTPMSHDVSKKIISVFKERTYGMFSPRENQIINLLGQGSTYKDMARKLFVTPSTINFHLQNIYVKLNGNSKSEALTQLKQLNTIVY